MPADVADVRRGVKHLVQRRRESRKHEELASAPKSFQQRRALMDVNQPLGRVFRDQAYTEEIAPPVSLPARLPPPVLLPGIGEIRPAALPQLRDQPEDAILAEAAGVDKVRLHFRLIEARCLEGDMATYVGSAPPQACRRVRSVTDRTARSRLRP